MSNPYIPQKSDTGMDQLIRSVTKKFTKLLPDDTSFYTPDDLREFDIPEFVVRRVEVEIYRNLNESIVPPHSEWADMSAEGIEYAWDQFIEAIVAEVRMPASFAPSVFETSVADVIEIILHPRSAIPAILFGPETTLTKEELAKRIRFITVNTHLAEAVLKYMDRKEKKTIDLSVCKKIVERVDDRLTENYNSLNWAQFLHPLFILSGPEVDSELFRIFFEDREMNRISRRFDMLSESLNKTGFIEVLSSPDLLNEKGHEEEQTSLFDTFVPSSETETESDSAGKNESGEQSATPQVPKSSDKSADDHEIPDKKRVPQKELNIEEQKPANSRSVAAPHEEEKEDDEDEDTLLSSFRSKLRPESETDNQHESDEESEDIRYSRFSEENEEADEEEPVYIDLADEPEEEDTPDPDSDPEPLPERSQKAGKQESKEEQINKPDEGKGEVEKKEDPDDYKFNLDEISESPDDSKPIWQSFLGDEDHIEENDIEEPKYSPFADNDGEDEDEPLIDLTREQESELSAGQLIGWMESDERRFTESIFSGSEAAYEQALVELDSFDNWKQASGYIEKEIFARNFVDMYDEDAVDFTDRMQAYFDQFKS